MSTSVILFWVLFAAIALARQGIASVTAAWWRRTKQVEDVLHPDRLPLTTGQWVHQTLERLGLGHLQVVASKDMGLADCYWPSARFIHLQPETFYKRDPGYWATGAHEIGHALYWRLPGLGLLFGLARFSALVSLSGEALLLVNAFYGDRELLEVTFWLLAVGLGGLAIVLLDEALASLRGMALLREDGRLTSDELASAGRKLRAAWLTYFASFAGGLVQFGSWSWLADWIVADPAPRGEPLGGWGLAGGWILSVLLALNALRVLLLILVPSDGASTRPPPKDEEERAFRRKVAEKSGCTEQLLKLPGQLCTLLLLLLIGDQADGLFFHLSMGMAVWSAWSMVSWIIVPVLLPIIIPIVLLKKRLTPPPLPEVIEDEDKRTLREEMTSPKAVAELEAMQDQVAEAKLETLRSPDRLRRLARLREIAYVPALIAFWALVA